SALTLLVAGLALGACQTGRGEPPAAVSAQAVAVTPAVELAVAEPVPQVAARPPINDDPAQLMGLDRDGLSNLLGAPDLVRRETPAEVWQYVADDCVFDVVLYQ